MYLRDILAHKRVEVQQRRHEVDLRHLQDLLLDAPAVRPFAQALRRPDRRMGLIAEVKKASPSAGVIQPNFNPVQQAKNYQTAGADCLSILTDEKFFQGSLDDLRQVRSSVDLPCLRKDFTVDPFQIYEARAAGADAILLIVAALSVDELSKFSDVASELGMASLIEVHTEDEMKIALDLGAKLIGINSRNLKTFEVDLAVVEQLAKMVPDDVLLVGESGIKTRDDVLRLKTAGVSAVLVGETLMRASDTEAAVHELLA